MGRTATQPSALGGRGHGNFSPCSAWRAGRDPSVLLGLDVALVVIRAVVVHGAAGVEPWRGVLQGQAHVGQLLLDLFDRLGAEVADVQQVLLAAGDKLAHRVDALALQAVVRPDGEVQLLDRQDQVRGQRRVRRRRADVYALGLEVELPGQPEQLDQGLARARDRIARAHRGLGLDVDDQPVEVGPLLDTGRLHLVGDPQHRRVDRVDGDPADLLPGLLVLGGRHVTAAALDRQFHLQLALAVERGDVQVGVVHLDARGRRDVGGRDLTWSLLAQVHDDRLVLLGGDDEFLEVQDDVGDVLGHPGHGGELVQDALDPDAGHRCARNRRQQRPPQRVANGVPEPRLQRLDDEPGPELVHSLFGEGGTLGDEHDYPSPRRPLYDAAISGGGRCRRLARAFRAGRYLRYFEYSSTMSCSCTWVSIWARAGMACTSTRILSGTTSSHAGTWRSPASARATMNGVSSSDLGDTSTMSLSVTR